MNVSASNAVCDAVENIVFPRISDMPSGMYSVAVTRFCHRDTENPGFTVQVDVKGEVTEFVNPGQYGVGNKTEVLKFSVDANKNVMLLTESGVASTAATTQEVWGINTNTWVPVKAMMHSPNAWGNADEEANEPELGSVIGNKHTFFMLEGCSNPEDARGIYNEFLHGSLHAHRKAMELIGSKIKATNDPHQLSGLGFSHTSRGHVYVRVTGATTRILKVTF